MKEKVQEVLEDIRPGLQMDGGDVELLEVDEKNGIVKVKLRGACGGCAMAGMTLAYGIEENLKAKIPEVKKVVSI